MRQPLYPIILAIAVVLSLWVDFALHPASAMRAVLVAAVGATFLTVLAGLAFRSRHRGAGAAASWLVLTVLGLPVAAGALVALGSVAAIWTVDRRHGRIDWPAVSAGGNAVSVALVIVIAGRWVFGGGIAQLARDLAPMPTASPQSSPINAPDIYLVLLDAYPRADWVIELVGFDNTPFLSALDARGFDVSSESQSNYDATTLTLNSMFNLAYIEDIPALSALREGREGTAADYRNAINESVAFDILREHGYRLISVLPGWEEVAIRRADVVMDAGMLNELELAVLLATSIGLTLDQAAPDFFGAQYRQRTIANLAALEVISAQASLEPRFVFIHVPSPHFPIVFNADGSPRSAGLAATTSYTADDKDLVTLAAPLSGQIVALNARVLDALDGMAASSDRERVIVLFSDHGSKTDALGDVENVSNFLAARTPGHPNLLGPTATPVNLLRDLFRAYLDEDLDRLPDRSFRTEAFRPPAFREVTIP